MSVAPRGPSVTPFKRTPGGGGGDMEARLRDIEIQQAIANTKLDGIDAALRRIDERLGLIEAKSLTKWDVAVTMAMVLAFTAACVRFGPDIILAIQTSH